MSEGELQSPRARVRMIENTIEVAIELGPIGRLGKASAFLHRLEDQVRLARLWIVRTVAERIARHDRVVTVADVDEDEGARW